MYVLCMSSTYKTSEKKQYFLFVTTLNNSVLTDRKTGGGGFYENRLKFVQSPTVSLATTQLYFL